SRSYKRKELGYVTNNRKATAQTLLCIDLLGTRAKCWSRRPRPVRQTLNKRAIQALPRTEQFGRGNLFCATKIPSQKGVLRVVGYITDVVDVGKCHRQPRPQSRQ